jgi:hypothetical protein
VGHEVAEGAEAALVLEEADETRIVGDQIVVEEPRLLRLEGTPPEADVAFG